MWTGSSLVEWLVGLGMGPNHSDPNARVEEVLLGYIGINIPQTPNKLVVATPTAGASRTDQRLFKRPGFQLRVRGPARDKDSSRAGYIAAVYHELILSFPDSTHLPDGNYLRSVQQVGGEPAQVGPRDSSERAEFFSNYLLDVRA